MKHLTKKLALIAIIVSCWSCEENDLPETETIDVDLIQEVVHTPQEELKRDFATSLAAALAESSPLRDFIKNQALKKFDNDYDVLYQMVKGVPLSDGSTMKSLLEKHMANPELLSAIEEALPTLSIFVPSLPESSFSAELWNTDSQIPEVAYNVKSTNHVPIIKNDGESHILADYLIPTFPVLVVKENERVVVAESDGSHGISSRISEKSTFQSVEGMRFRFLDDSFNAALNGQNSSQNVNDAGINARIESIDPKLQTAYDVFEGTSGWQRDHIYYDLTPSSTKGPFSYDYQEHITSFRMRGGGGWSNGVVAYNKIADQTGDPRIGIRYRYGYPETYGSWTDGIFEFKVIALVNGQNGVGNEYITYFPAPPRDLFRIRTSTPQGENYNTVRLRNLRTKRLYVNLPLVKWDLDQYASSIKIEIEEVDRTETISTTDTRTVKFAQNFGFDLGFGEKVKIGLKFGAEREETKTSSITKTYTLNSDKLGAVIMNFADDCVRKTGTRYYAGTRYQTGWFELDLEPVRVQ